MLKNLRFRSALNSSPTPSIPTSSINNDEMPNETEIQHDCNPETTSLVELGAADTISIAESSGSSSRGGASTSSLYSRRESLVPPYVEQDSSNVASSSRTRLNSDPMTSTATYEEDEIERRRQRARARRQPDTFRGLQSISEANGSSASLVSSQTSFTPSLFGVNSSYARRMQETGKLRRLQSQQVLPPVLPPADRKNPLSLQTETTAPPPPSGPTPNRSRPVSEFLPPYSSPTETTYSDTASALTNESEPPAPEIEPPTNIDSPLYPSLVNEIDTDTRLAQVLRELEAAKAIIAQTATERQEERASLLARLAASEERSEQISKLLTEQNHALSEARSELRHTHASLSSLTEEKRGWDAKLDIMHHKVQRAERMMRSIDHLTRAKVEAREAAVRRAIRRSKQIASLDLGTSAEVVGAVTTLNEEILQLANIFVENLERTKAPPTSEGKQRAKFVLGEGMTSMMEVQARDGQSGFPFLLIQVVLEVFMTSWCSAIVDGHYPQLQTFADLLLEMSAQSLVNASRKGHVPRIQCGKPIQVVQTNAMSTMLSKFPEWVDEIIDDLSQILLIGGLKIRSHRSQMFADKFLGLVEISYNLRAALAERDICGGLELCMVAPDTPFQPKWMEQGHEGHSSISELDTEPVAGTSGLGLQRHPDANSSSASSVIIKPKVVLLSVLQENL